jgi:hypothetical protein
MVRSLGVRERLEIERLGRGVDCAQALQHVVHVGEGQRGVAFLLALAVRVEPLGDSADARLLGCAGRGEGNLPKQSEWL